MKKSLTVKVFDNIEIQKLSQDIAVELENRNQFPLVEFPQYLSEEINDDLATKCLDLCSRVKKIINNKDVFSKFLQSDDKYVKNALFMAHENNGYNLDKVSVYTCVNLIQKKYTSLDKYVDALKDVSLCQKLKIITDKDNLVDLNDDRMILKNHGIVFNETKLIFPHQFLRRFYHANFVGIPPLLKKALNKNLKVKVRLDPFRETTANFYQDLVEADYWHGPKFSEKLLQDKKTEGMTLHKSLGIYGLSYHVQATIFRTKMKGDSIREFMIEEYCPLIDPWDNKSCGVGKKYCIQKFAHFNYDQNKKVITHLDGAIRVFEIKEYQKYFEQIEQDHDVDDKIGVRHKLFLVEGNISEEFGKDLLIEWFRYNPHIIEYFTNTTIETMISYEEHEKLKNKVSI